MEDFAVILAGGRGERFWPVSRLNKPKQILKLFSDKTMLDETLSRVEKIVEPQNIKVITSENLKKLISQKIQRLEDGNFFIEPMGKNTAPAIAYAATKIVAEKGDGVMYVLSSDHQIKPVGTFVEALKAAREIAISADKLVLLGIEPSRPETGYGYIESGEPMEEVSGFVAYNVRSFKEKPNRMLAQEYYLDGQHLWNSGIFVWKASQILKEIEHSLPELHKLMMKFKEAVGTNDEDKVKKEVFKRIEAISIDYGVLEKSMSVAVLRAKFAWDDVGSYAALERILDKDHEGNVTTADTSILMDTYESTIINQAPGLVVTYGISDLVVVRMDDALLIIHKTKIPQIREVLEKIKNRSDLEEYL